LVEYGLWLLLVCHNKHKPAFLHPYNVIITYLVCIVRNTVIEEGSRPTFGSHSLPIIKFNSIPVMNKNGYRKFT